MEVSVIIPTYNHEHYLERAISSILTQTMPKALYEVIVVDDGSTDNTKTVLDSFKENIRVVSLEENKGLPYAKNIGIRKALGKYVIFLDSDDFVHSDLLKVEHLYLSLNPHIDAVSCDYHTVDDKGEVIARKSGKEEPIACGTMFRKSKIIQIGLYDESFLMMEDLDLRKRFLDSFNLYNIPIPFYRYRMHNNNLTNNSEKKKKYLKKLNDKYNEEYIEEKILANPNAKEGLEKC